MADSSEMDDFHSSIERRGFQQDDFELTEQREPASGTATYSIRGTITIRYKPNGKERIYKTGHGSSWPAQFDDDLAGGVFGKPST